MRCLLCAWRILFAECLTSWKGCVRLEKKCAVNFVCGSEEGVLGRLDGKGHSFAHLGAVASELDKPKSAGEILVNV